MSAPVYALWINDGGPIRRHVDGVFSRKVAMQLAAAHRKASGKKVYARRVDIALTRQPTNPKEQRA